MTILSILIGMAIGYALGYKNDKTLKQQIYHLKQTVRKNNKSAQLKELTIAELKERDDWDFRTKLAEVTGQSVTDNLPITDDPNSMKNTF